MKEIENEKVYMGIDVETTSQYLSNGAMIALGAVVMDAGGKTLHTFKVCLAVPPYKGWEPRCLAEFWLHHETLKAAIERDAIDAEKAMRGFARWLNLMDLVYGDRLVLLTDNPAFDVAWINLYLHQYTNRPSLYYGFSFDKVVDVAVNARMPDLEDQRYPACPWEAGPRTSPSEIQRDPKEKALEIKEGILHSQVGYPEDYAMQFALSEDLDPADSYENGEITLQSNVVKAVNEDLAFLSLGGGAYYSYRRIWDTNSAFHGALYAHTGRVHEWGLEGALDVQNAVYANDHDVLHDAANIAANYILFLEKFKALAEK